MNEEELLLFKEELAEIKMNRYGFLGLGVFMGIFGIVLALTTFTGDVSLYRLTLIFFGAIATICILVSELKFGRDYEDKLKELKKLKKE